ncbi:hypothetical protein FRB90_010466 [Tulasnella sp. 427]|nr:hypothetical protein FRB90_010466 [Tulasnella sp. 427]
MSEVQLTQRNLVERGVTPPPEEKVAYYVYQQSKVQVDRPESNYGTEILRGYASEPVAWAPEVPLDWHSQEFMPGQPGYGQQTRNNSSGNIASNSYPSMSRLGLNGQPNPHGSIDRDFMDLEAEIMGLGGSEVDYGFQKGNIPDIDIASDVQEQSVGDKSPNFRTAPLADTVDTVRSPAASARRIPQRDSGGTPTRGGKVPLAVPTIRGESAAANTPKTTAIQINIQPPTDPSLSRVPSMAIHDSPTKRSGAVSGTPRAQSPRPASPSPLRNAASTPGPARPSPLSHQAPEPQPPLPSTPATPRTPAKVVTPILAPLPVESQPPVQTETAPARPTKKGKMAKKKGGKAGKKGAKAREEREEDDIPTPVHEPATPVVKSPVTPAMGVQVTNKFSPSGHVESIIVSMPVPQPVIPPASPARSRALDLQMTPQAGARDLPSRAPSRAQVLASPRIVSRTVTPAPRTHTPRDSFDFNAPLPGSTDVHGVPLPDPHSTDYAISPTSPTRRSHLGHHTEEGTVTVRGPGRSRAGSRATELRSPTVKGGTVRAEPLDPNLNGGDTVTLQKFLDSNTPKPGTRHLGGSRVPSEHPASPRASERARHIADDGFGADGRRQEEFVSVPASQFRPSSRASNTPTATPIMPPRGEPSLTDMWQRFQGGEAVAPESDHHEPPPASPLSPAHSRAGSRFLDAPGKARSKQSSVPPSPAPQTSHFRQPAAARDSILKRLDSLDSKLEASRPSTQNSLQRRHPYDEEHGDDEYIDDDYEPGSDINRTPRTPHQRIASGEIDMPDTGNSSRFRRGDRRGYEAEDDMDYEDAPHSAPSRESGIEEELYRIRMKNPADYNDSVHSEAPIPEIPGSEFDDRHDAATPTPRRVAANVTGESSQEVTPHSNGPAFVRPRENWTGASAPNWGVPSAPPWQLVHQRLLNWTIVWSMSELDRALESTERGRQVDECALTVWTMQCYKRYVRVKSTDHPPQRVDRLFVPPNVADAINSAVYNGRHADATVMLKDLWAPYGFDEMPRLILVLARHRRDNNHWVVHRFSIPEGTLCTYDTYPEKALADGRPLGWWFAIRAAWPHAMYPNPDHLVQKLVRIHRPLQLLIDNSVAAAAIWRNLLMGSKAERSVDLVRMRDLIHTEVRAMKLRKEQGKLALPASRASWDHQITES